MSVPRTVAIVGGGVAGIAAAVRAAESGWRPILLETRTRLGGRASSFEDVRTGVELDNCQHVVMGCCTNVLDLYDRLGVLEAVEWQATLCFARGGGAFDRLAIAPFLPAPFHYLPSLVRMRLFGLGEKLAIARAFAAILRMGPKGRIAWQGRAFSEFLDSTRQPLRVVRLFWDQVVTSACNVPSSGCDAALALKVFDEGMLAHRFAGAVGVPRVPLGRLYARVAGIVADAGGELRLRTSARAIAFDGTRVTGVVCEDGVVAAQAVIAAVPPDRLARLCSDTLRAHDRRLADLDLSFSPILGVHLGLRRRILEVPNLALPGRATHWLFAHPAPEASGLAQRLEAVASSSADFGEAFGGRNEAELVARVLEDVRWALPDFRDEDLAWARPVLEKRATFTCMPGVDRRRPGPRVAAGDLRGGVPNLFLAGEWTDVGWPSTMEGAARSGYAAASACTGGSGPCPDLPASALVRLARA